MFSTKQSDIFYNDETKEMFVCKVSAISADRCDGSSELVYGAVPLVYKIDKNTNYKSRVYPRDIDSFSLSANSDLFSLTPNCPEGTNFNSITKPLINYNKDTSRYSVTFLGRYSNDTEGLGLNNYIFQDINSYFYLLDANIYIPKAKFTDDQFTFESGHLNSDLYVVGNTIRNDKPSWFNPANVEVERSTDYQIAPMHVQATSSLGFNLALGNTDVAIDSLSGNVAFPFMYSGGFITYNPKYVAYDPEYTIRVDFRARSFTVPSPTAYGSSQSVGQSATRWIQQWATPLPGEGFCVSFFKNPPKNSYVIPNGIGSTLGYAKAGFSPNEVAGTSQATDGLHVHNNWRPNTGTKPDDPGKYQISSDIGGGNIGNFGPADSFLGIGFDIGGNFATTSEEKTGAYADNKTFTAKTCSIGIRGSSYHETKALTSFKMDTVAASAVPMHTSAANADFVDYRIDLSNKGTKVTLYNKLTSATDYNTITELRLNKIGGGNIGEYTPWEGLRSAEEIKNKQWPLLNVGLSFTTSDNVSRFELHKFEVTGVKVTNPWEVKIEKKTEAAKRIDYLQESSKNLRKKLLNVESDDLVDVEMVVPAKNIIANTINEETNKPQITMCDGSNPDTIEDDVDIKITGIRPEQVDKAIEVGASGYTPNIPGGVTTIKHVGRDLDIDTVIDASGATEKVSWDSWLRCRIPGIAMVEYEVQKGEGPRYVNRRETATTSDGSPSLNHTGRFAWLVMTDRTYSIYVQVLVLDKFHINHEDDLNDWFVKHPFGGIPEGSRQRGRSEGTSSAIKANSILKSIIKAFIDDPTIDRKQYNWALAWHPGDAAVSKNSLLTRTDDKGVEYIGMDEKEWVEKFTNMGFVNLPSDWKNPQEAAFGSNTLKQGTVPEFGDEWACANSWEPKRLASGALADDDVSTGFDGGEGGDGDPKFDKIL